jgi:hypothetical protein
LCCLDHRPISHRTIGSFTVRYRLGLSWYFCLHFNVHTYVEVSSFGPPCSATSYSISTFYIDSTCTILDVYTVLSNTIEHLLICVRIYYKEHARFRFETARFGAQRDAREQLRQHGGDGHLMRIARGVGFRNSAMPRRCCGTGYSTVERQSGMFSCQECKTWTRTQPRGGSSTTPSTSFSRGCLVSSTRSSARSASTHCIMRELPNAPVLVTLDRPRLSQEGRASTTVVEAQRVLAPAISAHRVGIVETA